MAIINKRIKALIDKQVQQKSNRYSLEPLPSFYPTPIIDSNLTTDATTHWYASELAGSSKQRAVSDPSGAYSSHSGPHGVTTELPPCHHLITEMNPLDVSDQPAIDIPRLTINASEEPLVDALDQLRLDPGISDQTKHLSNAPSQISPNPNEQYAHAVSSLARAEIELRVSKGRLPRNKSQPSAGSPLLH